VRLCVQVTFLFRVLINTSGSGKTRLLLEGLCRRWGFYFVAKPDSAGTGSRDLWQIISEFDNLQDYTRARIKQEENPKTTAAIKHMQETAKRGFAQLLLARFLLLNLLVREAKNVRGGLKEKVHRRLWVLLQAQPVSVFGKDFDFDVFTEFARLLRPADLSELHDRIRAQYRKLSFLLTKVYNPATGQFEAPPLFLVADEAQITTTLRYGQFFSEDNSSKRSVLREIWLSWTSVLDDQQMRIVLAGTGIELQTLVDTLASPALKPERYQIWSDIGAFEDSGSQAEYIKKYIPANWTDERWAEFLIRAWAWFRGR
jgi:hypothetical protein